MQDVNDKGTLDLLKRGRGRPASGLSKAEQNRRNVAKARAKRNAELKTLINTAIVHSMTIMCLAYRSKDWDVYSVASRIYMKASGIEETDASDQLLLERVKHEVETFDVHQAELEIIELSKTHEN